MAVFLAVRPLSVIRGATLLWVVAGFGVTIIGFGVSHVFWFSFLMLALGGAFDSVSMIIRSTLMQLLTPDSMRGRVSAINSMFIISSNEIGAFESGMAASLLGHTLRHLRRNRHAPGRRGDRMALPQVAASGSHRGRT